MSNKQPHQQTPFDTLKNESARQRWQLFHRAIAHAKQSNTEALQQLDTAQPDAASEADQPAKPAPNQPRFSIAR